MSKPFEDVYRLCPCGSGQKYKFCCLGKDRQKRHEMFGESSWAMGPGGEPILFADLGDGERLCREGQQLMEAGRTQEAIPFFERSILKAPFVPQPHNNLALSHFMEGNFEKAVEIAERVDRVIAPGNVFGLGNLVHFQLIIGRRSEAERNAQRLENLPCPDESALTKKCEVFARLRWHEEVYAAATEGFRTAADCRPIVAFFAGTAAANLARYDESLPYLREATRHPGLVRRAKRYLSLIERRQGPGTIDGDWPYLDFYQWAPPKLIERMIAEKKACSFPGLVEALVSFLNDKPESESALGALAGIGTPEAIAVLRKIGFGTYGSDNLRMTALMELQKAGEISGQEPLDVWLRGEWQQVRQVQFELTDDINTGLPEGLLGLMGEMLSVLRSKKWKQAEKIGRDLLAQAPKVPQVLYNLAMSVRMQGRDEESEELLKEAIAQNSSYLFAPALLARIRLKTGRLTEARQILKEVCLPEKMTHEGYALLLLAEADLSVLEGNFEAAARAWETAEEIAPDLEGVQEMRESLGRRFVDFFVKQDERKRRTREQQRKRLLTQDAGLKECLEVCTHGQLRMMARALELHPARSKKEDLRRAITDLLKDAGTVRRLVESLHREAREALFHIYENGSFVSYEQFTRAHGSDEADYECGLEKIPETPLGRLKALGLLAEGTIGNRECVCIPIEIRRALDQNISSIHVQSA